MDLSVQTIRDSGKKKHGAGGRRLGSMKIPDVRTALRKMGFAESTGSRNNPVFTRDGKTVQLPNHTGEVGRNYIRNALRHAGITEEQFLEHTR